MTIRVGINGFGRMGRLGLRAGWDNDTYQIVRINEISTDAVGSAHLLKFDSVHGIWDHSVSASGDTIDVEGHLITHTSHKEIHETDWSDCDIVLEATGKHHKKT